MSPVGFKYDPACNIYTHFIIKWNLVSRQGSLQRVNINSHIFIWGELYSKDYSTSSPLLKKSSGFWRLFLIFCGTYQPPSNFSQIYVYTHAMYTETQTWRMKKAPPFLASHCTLHTAHCTPHTAHYTLCPI